MSRSWAVIFSGQQSNHGPYVRSMSTPCFPSGKNLFQLLWCPDQYHEQTNYGPYPRCVWRYVAEEDHTRLLQPHQVPRASSSADEFAIPRACSVHPERFEEYPDVCEVMRVSDTLPERVENWVADNAAHDLAELSISSDDNLYSDCWGASPNTKVGGWVYWMHDIHTFTCVDCGGSMEHLLSISSGEYGGGKQSRWYPIDEEVQEARDGPDFTLGDSESFVIFICRQCEYLPIRGRVA
ncbi:hypothetical protein FGB62_43g11 [Gracilaria domingensis]|nr:hypothetical protein FGB62_43g11 [Gracilaria domingensis]